MINVEIKRVKISAIRPNPGNPRTIGRKELNNLAKSLKEFPEMLQLREIVVDENMMILGGNMRYRALQEIGDKECDVKVAAGLTPEQKLEFIIKDNGQMGDWDFDALANGWDGLPLADWGVDLPGDWLSIDKQAANNESGRDQIEELFQVLIECETEAEQVELLTEFNERKLKCKALIS
jgi:hypothetical protein